MRPKNAICSVGEKLIFRALTKQILNPFLFNIILFTHSKVLNYDENAIVLIF